MLSSLLVMLGSVAEEPITFTTYRVTPITYPGVSNMDSGDAAGDVMFGLEQLLLPQLCATDPSFLWCRNRQFLSGGTAWMVYSEFEIATRPAFGEYQPCNPCSGQAPKHGGSSSHDMDTYCPPGVPNGTFVCSSYGGGGPPPPPQCQSGFDVWHQDCLNGTIYKNLTGLAPATAEGSCCAACSASKECAGWNMPDGANGTTCQLMKEPLIMWEDGQTESKCKAARVDHDSYNCWWQNPYYNTTFGPYCDRAVCKCDVIAKSLPVGRELDPMCHKYQDPTASASASKYTAAIAATAGPADLASFRSSSVVAPHWVAGTGVDTDTAKASNYWTCSDALEHVCFDGYMPTHQCTACAVDKDNKAMLAKAGCTPAYIEHLCHASFDSCDHKLERVCGKNLGHKSCQSCVEANTGPLEMANCTSTFVQYACSGGGGHDNKWSSYIDKLSCVMEGAWYSTNAIGKCKEKKLTPDCWWYVAQEKRTVNASCVDGNVAAAVQKRRPDCWTECPDGQGTNISSACYLTCLYETLLGNSTTGIKAMTKAEIVAPFVASFTSSDPTEGGCPSVHKGVDLDAVAAMVKKEPEMLDVRMSL